MIVHFPVVLGAVGLLLMLLCAVMRMQNGSVRWIAFAVYALMAVSAYAAFYSGENAADALPRMLPGEAGKLMVTHEWMAEFTWLFAAFTAFCLLMCAIQSEGVRATFTVLGVLAALATAGWIAVTANYGWMMVYRHGIGTMSMGSGLPADPAQTPRGASEPAAAPETVPAGTASEATPPLPGGLEEAPPLESVDAIPKGDPTSSAEPAATSEAAPTDSVVPAEPSGESMDVESRPKPNQIGKFWNGVKKIVRPGKKKEAEPQL